MIEEENLPDEPELRIFSRFDKIRNKNSRIEKFQEQIATLLQRDKISETMARNFVELLDINPAYYWPRKYRYTLEQDAGKLNPLTIKQRNHFERNGYLLIRNLIPKVLLNLLIDCPGNEISKVLQLILNQKELLTKVKTFCGEKNEHVATMIIDSLYSQSFQLSKNELNQDPTSFAKLAQHFYQFSLHPADRLLGCLICVEDTNQLSICVEPASHQSSRLEIEMRDADGELVKKIYEKPIRRLETLNEQGENRKLVSLQPGDVFFYHPLLAQSIIFETQTTENEIFLENSNSNQIGNPDLETKNRILALNVFFGSSDLTRVIRELGAYYKNSANLSTPMERIKLLDQLFEENQTLEKENQLLKDENKLLSQAVHVQTDDLKSLNVQIYIGNSIVNLEQILADAGQTENFAMKSHL